MKTRLGDDRGFSLVEVLVVMSLFSVVSIGLYQVMISGVRGSETANDVATISQEARLGFNRMLRDTREASNLLAATATSYTITVVFPGSTTPEELTYSYHAGSKTIRLKMGTDPTNHVLVEGAEPIGSTPVFTYSSNRLEYDWNADGITSMTELEEADDHGVTLDVDKLRYVASVDYAFQIVSGSRASEFYAQAQLRNRR